MPAKRTGTGYQNLQTYLSLNRGAAQGMGDALASDVEARGGGVADDITDASRRFGTAAHGGGADMSADDPNLTAAQAEALSKQGYAGPRSLSDVTDVGGLYGRAVDAQARAGAIGSNAGRATLLRERYGMGTQGGGALDAALAGQGGSGERLNAAHGAYGRLVSRLQGAESAAQGIGSAAAKTAEANQASYAAMVPGLRAKEQSAAAAQQESLARQRAEADATAAAGGEGRRGDNARNVAAGKGSAGGRYGETPLRTVGSGKPMSEAEARRIGRGIHYGIGGF